MADLDGSSRSLELAPGYRITAPGLRGTAAVHEARAAHTRDGGPEGATDALDRALENTGVNDLKTIELEVRSEPVPATAAPVRTATGEDGLVLEVPDLGETVGQIVLAIDEEGVVTWNFPEDVAGRRETPAIRGAGGAKRFVIRRAIPPTPLAAESARRGLVRTLGRKLLKVLVYPVTDAVLGPISEHYAGRWEERNRPYRVRPFDPDSHARAEAPELDADGWQRLAAGRSLLFIHGTFSYSHIGFAELPRATLEELHRIYGGRMFAFDHFTLSQDPEENVARFRERVPPGVELDLDVICHSRGGLVARTLAGELGGPLPGVAVGRVVFVGTPNHGTQLADPDHMTAMIDRFTSIFNLAPAGPLSVVADVLEAIITAVKMVGHGALAGLRGLASMDPGGEFIRRINAGVEVPSEYYAITSDFEPGGGLRELVKGLVADQVVDRVFQQAANDLVVPTQGVFEGSADPSFPIPGERLLAFKPASGVAHTRYFGQSDTSAKLVEWLLADRA